MTNIFIVMASILGIICVAIATIGMLLMGASLETIQLNVIGYGLLILSEVGDKD